MKLHLGYILGLFAIALATSAGYISVVGWGKLFAGEAIVVMIVMAIIEAAKVVTTIYLHRYGSQTKFALKTYLIIGVIATMFLTSVGVYGFLTNAYQATANKLELQNGGISILESKKYIFLEKIDANKKIIETKNTRVSKLSELRTQQEVRLDGYIQKNQNANIKKARMDIESANMEIQKLTKDIDDIVNTNAKYSDSINYYQIKILEVQSTGGVAAEIGPLKYISTLTGKPMDSIINWLVLIIIFIFDPMAISLVLATNRVFDLNKDIHNTEMISNTILSDDITNNIITHEMDEVNIDNNIEPEPSGSTNETIHDSVNPKDNTTNHNDDIVLPIIQHEDKKNKINPNPVIPTGNVKREEIKEIKEGTRGYSVNVPQPKRIGTNKEVRLNEPNKFFFQRPKQ